MTERRRGLGRGLGALIPTAPADENGDNDALPQVTALEDSPDTDGLSAVSRETPGNVEAEPQLVSVDGARFAELDVDAIHANPRQPRQVFDEEALEELAHSIKHVGLLQPIVVRTLADEQYELVMGERRLRAAQRAGVPTIPAIVRDTPDDDLLRDALLENLHRVQLNPLEEAAAYEQLLEDFDCTHAELSDRIGRSRPQISNTLRLLKLPALVQRRVAAGVLSAGHARALLAIEDAAAQERLAQRIVAEGLSVRTVEELVATQDDSDNEAKDRRKQPKPRAPRLDDIADSLSNRLETRVKVDLGRSKGKVTIEFASIEDLERIVGVIGD